MGEVVVVVCTFNYRIWKRALPMLPVMSALAEVEFPACASSTWTIPGTIAIMTGKQDWENPSNPIFAWRNLGWDDWDKLHPTYGEGDVQRLVDEWDREGTAFLFIRTMHFPYSVTDQLALMLVDEGRSEELEDVYERQLFRLDKVLEPLLQLDVPVLVVGDHGEDFTVREMIYMHHNNHSEENLKVPMFGRGFTDPSMWNRGIIMTKYAIPIVQNGYVGRSEKVCIWSEGPKEGDWKYIVIDILDKTIVTKDGITVENWNGTCQFTSLGDHSKLNARLRALGYL